METISATPVWIRKIVAISNRKDLIQELDVEKMAGWRSKVKGNDS